MALLMPMHEEAVSGLVLAAAISSWLMLVQLVLLGASGSCEGRRNMRDTGRRQCGAHGWRPDAGRREAALRD